MSVSIAQLDDGDAKLTVTESALYQMIDDDEVVNPSTHLDDDAALMDGFVDVGPHTYDMGHSTDNTTTNPYVYQPNATYDHLMPSSSPYAYLRIETSPSAYRMGDDGAAGNTSPYQTRDDPIYKKHTQLKKLYNKAAGTTVCVCTRCDVAIQLFCALFSRY